ncbi:translation initiation factor IF-2 [Gynuella sunshinyii]|uniref:Translation initiation factor IF-2 n=1 Tax=Gynuella sunshinyii YC6258 TaxID=1445510 RepID=A0A0C5VSW8_9GAMM|nr:translation initiation factor IF-2 [Gynuella sunshinyii]AJQ97276.1 translation initiation factor 2 (IF-2; GTPase) [Gynuella sunshinyii YC6258]
MAEVTVKELAENVGTPVDRLLGQMKEAGLPHSNETDSVSDEEKQALLAFLKKSHGESSGGPKKITLKRKVTTQIKSSSLGGRAKTVNIEVRKKRTYVKKETTVPVEEEQLVSPSKREEENAKLEAARLREQEEKAKAEQQKQAKIEAEEAAKVTPSGEAAHSEQPAEPSEQRTEAVDAEEPVVNVETAVAETESTGEAAETVKVEVVADSTDEKSDSTSKNERKTGKEAKKEQVKEARSAREEREETRRPSKKTKGEAVVKEAVVHHKPVERHKGNKHQQILEMLDDDGDFSGGRRSRRRKSKRREHQFQQPTQPVVRDVSFGESISVSDLANQMSVKSAEVVKVLFKMGVVSNPNMVLDQDTAILVVEEMGHKYTLINENQLEENLISFVEENVGEELPRAPVVTVMGHVDHGKTSLLDYIRKTRVAAGESGGITQHIGAYHVETANGMVTFLDTPGHAAFTAMRARGAQSTDVVILVVAADDGVMPQTEEAIQHAKAAGVPIVVAINKIDKEAADPDRVTSELSAKDVVPESWGGDTQFVQVSAHTGQGIDALLDAVLLQAEVLELKSVVDARARGVVVESSLDRGRGSVSTVLVQTGTLRKGDIVLAGECFGKVRALLDETGEQVQSAGPSIPVQILGLDGTPTAGDDFIVVESERKAREVAEFRKEKARQNELAHQQATKLDNLFADMTAGEVATLNIVLKADVQGSLEALRSSLLKLGNEEVKVNIVSGGVGAITESDANLAVTASAVIFGFNVRASGQAREIIERQGLDLRYYSVIYNIIDDVKAALSGLLSPELREEIVGVAEVRDVFNSPKFGQIAGCMVVEGIVYRNKKIRVLRDDVVIYEGELESLRRFKDDVQEVRNGMECGIGVKNYTDVKVGDKIEVFDIKEIARTID